MIGGIKLSTNNFRLKSLMVIAFFTLLISAKPIQSDKPNLKPSYTAFQRGEELNYRIHYGLVNAGKATFHVRDTLVSIGGKPHFSIKVFGRSKSTWDWFYKVRDHYYTYMDTNTYLPSIAYRNVREGSYKTKERLVFKREDGVLLRNGEKRNIPEGIHDILSAIYYARCINFSKAQTGAHLPIKTFFSDSLFPVGVTYKGKSTVKTNFGKFKCRIFEPELVKGRIFKGQDDMTVYVSDDRNQVPLRIESKIFVGKIQADLKSFENLKYPLKARIE